MKRGTMTEAEKEQEIEELRQMCLLEENCSAELMQYILTQHRYGLDNGDTTEEILFD